MRFLLAIIAAVGLAMSANAQCYTGNCYGGGGYGGGGYGGGGYGGGYPFGDTLFITNSGYGRASVVFKTGFADVACAGGICLVPTETGYGLQGVGFNNVAIIPQSTAFFALSNPQVFQFRVREFTQIPGTNAIVTTDSYGNQIEVINAGIGGQGTLRSRGQNLYVR